MNTIEKYDGFSELSVTPLTQLDAQLHFYRHNKTGAELIWLERASENKTFSIAFQTIPEDDTGVFHILEHSVLCGSEKYPVKEPFVELLKGSLHTFLNAMTFPDKTVYPVSSRNDADFLNLMRVYLDAVFRPNIYKNANIFRQEGWHYELDANGTPSYVGVVFGEMKGAFSSVDEIIYTKLGSMLFPESSYRFCSGGDPEHIPELSYEQFIEAHRRFYHPSNAKIFLDGTLPINHILADIDAEYLSKYERREADFTLSYQSAIAECTETVEYELSPEETVENKTHFAMAKIVGTWQDIEKLTAMQVLTDYLAGSNSAPITRAVLEQGLGQDFGIVVDDSIAQPYMMLQIRNCADEKLSVMKAELRAIFDRVLNQGLDQQELAASLNRLEFRSKERKEPFGVGLALASYKSWMYGGDPSLYLDMSGVFASLRQKIDSPYFTELLKQMFLDDQGMAVLTASPSHTIGEEKRKAETARLAAAADAWSDSEKITVQETQKMLSVWQQTQDTAQSLATIPHLSISDLSPEPLWTDCEEEMRGHVRILHPNLSTSGTVYLNLYFALPETTVTELSELSLMCELLGSLPTSSHTREMLARQIKTHLGEISFKIVSVGKTDDPNQAVCYLRASCSLLESNADQAVSLIREILLQTEFDHENMVREIIQQSFISAQQNLIMSGHQYAFRHVLSCQTAEGLANEATDYFGYYQYLKNASANLDFAGLLTTIRKVAENLISLPLTVGVTGQLSNSLLDKLLSGFGGVSNGATIKLDRLTAVKDAIVIPAGIAYAVQGGNLNRLGGGYHGSFALAAKILSLNYLWNEVRVQGGAYGSGINVNSKGDVFCYSYRDPNPSRSMGIYRGAADYLHRFCENKEPFAELLIGAVSDGEPLLSAADESRIAVENALRDVTRETRRKERKELLNASYEDLLRFAGLLQLLCENESSCIVGNEPLLDSCGEDAKIRLS